MADYERMKAAGVFQATERIAEYEAAQAEESEDWIYRLDLFK